MIKRPASAKHHPRDSEKTRARILQAAIELFSASSFDMVRSRDIADKAGIDVALINRYFGSKKGLFIAALEVISQVRPELDSEDVEKLFCKDFARRLSGEDRQNTTTAVRLIAFSASCAEVAPLLQKLITGEISRLNDKLGTVDKTSATAFLAYLIGMHTLLQMLSDEDRANLKLETLLEPIRAISPK